jgi:hypothetical protein
MAIVQWKKLNWIKTPSPWQQAQVWRAKRQAMAEAYRANGSNFMSGVVGAQSASFAGSVTVTTQLALTRIQAEAQAKAQAAAKAVNRTI